MIHLDTILIELSRQYVAISILEEFLHKVDSAMNRYPKRVERCCRYEGPRNLVR